jgi:MFS family permease
MLLSAAATLAPNVIPAGGETMHNRRNVNLIMVGVWMALVLALAGSLRHVAWSFSTLEHGDMLAGYVQAVAVDIGLAVLALGIQQRRRQRRGTAVLWIGVGMFSLISIYANLIFALVHEQDIAAGWLASWRPVLLSAVLPVLVLYLSEVAGSDVNYTVQVQEREDRREARKMSSIGTEDVMAASAEQARAALAEQRERSREQVQAAMLDAWRLDPTLGLTQIARQVGRSRTTAYKYLADLERAGRVTRANGTVRVLAEG